MKRYLYILLVAVLALVSCDTEIAINNKHIVFFNENINIETTESSATIETLKPYILNGTTKEEVVVYMEYWVEGAESAKQRVDQHAESNGYVIFTLEGLTPETTYYAYFAMGCQEHNEIEVGEKFSFTTSEHIPVAKYSCECQVEAKGVLANVVLNNLAFTLDDMEQPAKVEFKYSQSMSGGQWTTIELTAEDIANGFRIPAQEGAYLNEQSEYNYVVTLTPEDSNYEVYTINGKFTTIAAAITSGIPAPDAMFDGGVLRLMARDIKVYFDGVELKDYPHLDYGLMYRTYGNEAWSEFIEAEYSEQEGMTIEIPLAELKKGVAYEFVAAVRAGVTQQIITSDSIIIPIEDDTPAPPTPPVSGNADTTELAGQWHLTKWRGVEPGFDVYLSITEDGVVSLFQRMESRLWETFYSLVGYENGIIAGEYTDGVEWAHSYYVTIDGNTMTWTSTTDSSEVSVYTRCTLPDITNPEIRVTAASGMRFL